MCASKTFLFLFLIKTMSKCLQFRNFLLSFVHSFITDSFTPVSVQPKLSAYPVPGLGNLRSTGNVSHLQEMGMKDG